MRVHTLGPRFSSGISLLQLRAQPPLQAVCCTGCSERDETPRRTARNHAVEVLTPGAGHGAPTPRARAARRPRGRRWRGRQCAPSDGARLHSAHRKAPAHAYAPWRVAASPGIDLPRAPYMPPRAPRATEAYTRTRRRAAQAPPYSNARRPHAQHPDSTSHQAATSVNIHALIAYKHPCNQHSAARRGRYAAMLSTRGTREVGGTRGRRRGLGTPSRTKPVPRPQEPGIWMRTALARGRDALRMPCPFRRNHREPAKSGAS
ncbi:hypothetical protein HYPSUDRAFT_218451 [Hypholoma sublateritium FD-334 SS-4]|uniref:Uncharacterized protein n=1 Tax=Hypholoma sublateritium (strain FD-334 SS-4) TaxID=945553 RepID=A0A0D2KTZ3_HYPSF|nr:hypothetical protein HYPSUDRAFT_218451 [Hypholoma sublateritium FD-334 SS-4]